MIWWAMKVFGVEKRKPACHPAYLTVMAGRYRQVGRDNRDKTKD